VATYVTLYQFTDQGIKGVKDSPKRLKEGIKRFKQGGGKILAAYYTEGPYDLVVISETDDERMATAFALTQAAMGNVRSTTMRAHSPEDFKKIVELMP
jgi:uncharacterized protein with GYD domain